MDTRREFFKKAAILAGGAGALNVLLPAIEKAAAILPEEASTYLDAEHVVILMQENRSFDHCFGMLRGVRGFNDPRAVTLPNQNPVWLQTNAAGETYAPFRLDAQGTNATWLGGLPHSWSDQNDAKNGGDHDRWLEAKPVVRKDCPGMPLTMGYYDRDDLPFYYALADAFTVCDQHFCSSLTGTTPNRLYLWSGTIREEQHAGSPANVLNQHVDFGVPARWTTFPERLEDAGIDWKIYQNEISIPSGLTEEHDAWLTNFSDNPIEWFTQYAVEFAGQRRRYVDQLVHSLPMEIASLQKELNEIPPSTDRAKIEHTLALRRDLLLAVEKERKDIAELPERNRKLHQRAFTTNAGDAEYRELTTLAYEDGATQRSLQIPKGDILHQFREDVSNGKLPAVSWLVAPEKFSDHPTAPWFGAWYLAEAINILTQNPKVWKKTIFILTYDENDGFFDHVPPFGSPHPAKPETGSVSDGIDAAVEYVTMAQSEAHEPAEKVREGSIGLGFRVPLLIASPWSRGGAVCSQVFDHTSVLQLLEKFATHKSGKPVKETNISQWRRTVCGDLSSVFQPAQQKVNLTLPFPGKDDFIERIHKAKFKELPGYSALTSEQVKDYKANPRAVSWMPQQESGIRPACALPYELYSEGRLSADKKAVAVTITASDDRFGRAGAGSPFRVYAPGGYEHNGAAHRTRFYAVKAGQRLEDSWQLAGFPANRYYLCVSGPNGYQVEMRGESEDPLLAVEIRYVAKKDALQLMLAFSNTHTAQEYTVALTHHAYHLQNEKRTVRPGGTTTWPLDFSASFGWYDFSVRVEGMPHFERRYAGHIENGSLSSSDPLMGRVDARRS